MSAIIEFFANIVSWIVSLASACWDWFAGLFRAFGEAIMASVADSLPDTSPYLHYIEVVMPYIKFCNTWVAFDVGFWLLLAFLLFVLVFVVVKLIVKMIPFVG